MKDKKNIIIIVLSLLFVILCILVKLDLLNKKVVENPNPEFLPFVVYLCNDCKHIELRNITLNK